MKVKIKHGLTTRQFALYKYLKDQTDYVKQEQIARDLPEHYPCSEEDMKDFHNSTCRGWITADIRVLKESDYIPRVILSNGRGVKIPTEEEFNRHIGKMIMSDVRRLERSKKLLKKGKANGQLKLQLNGREKEFIEAFLEVGDV